MGENRVDVPEDLLERLVSFADAHGPEYGDAGLYFAVKDGKKDLGYEDTEPRDAWNIVFDTDD